jgi:hypothetical protein
MSKKERYILQNGIECIVKNSKSMKKLAGDNLLFFRADTKQFSPLLLKKSTEIRIKK